MTNLLIDTCVWLDIAKDPQQQKRLGVLDDLISMKEIELVVPQIVLDEFERNKTRIIEETKKSIFANIKRVKEVVSKFGEQDQKEVIHSQLTDLNHKAPLMGEYAAQGSVNMISVLLGNATIIPLSDEIKLKAAQRAIDKRAPFHRSKNSIGDAIIIETYASLIDSHKKRGSKFIFVTHNTQDFSDPSGNQKLPHPEFSELFSKGKSRYFINLDEAIMYANPDQYPESMAIQDEIYDEPKGFSVILAMENELVEKIWYNRHQVRKEAIEEGRKDKNY